ncbi:hypothetical protein LD39_13250 [Halobacillus sp. BBL2006]|nr:hypothetical protein LD39_13250 [Halobacillus sp. BBL2006]
MNLNNIDLVISYLFWKKIKPPLLSLPKIGAINFHPAPLPDYKGLGGYNAAILDQRKDYGVTAHFMNEKIDEGTIINKKMFNIDKENETAFSLELKSQVVMFKLFKEVIDNATNPDYLLKKTNTDTNNQGIYINKKMFEEMKIIHHTDSKEEIDRKIRAFWFPPYEGAKLKIGNEFYTLLNNNVLSDVAKVLH